MNLLEKYVAEIGKGLPRRSRADIETEIKSTLQDMLDERSARTGKPVDDAMVRDLLKEYGAPAKVAASYSPPRYLIGPRMYPIFELVLRIVVAVLVGVSLFGLIVSFANHSSGPDFIQALGQWAIQLFGGLIAALGNIVIVFAILERVLPASKLEKEREEEWDPSELEVEPDPAVIKPAEPIFAVLFTVIGLVILNMYPNLVGLSYVQDGRWITVPALSEAIFRYLPWINLLGVLQIAMNVVRLRLGHWTTPARIADMALETGSIILAVAMLAGPALVDISVEKLAGTPLAEASRVLAPMLNLVPIIVLVVIIVVSTIEVAQTIYKMVNRPAVFSPVK